MDGPHILTVNATASSNQTFWFDDIQYVPSASVPLDQAAIIVSSLDPQLQYGAGWEGLAGYGNMTSVTGSVFTYNFIGMQIISLSSLSIIVNPHTMATSGVSVSWYGWISAGGGPNQFGGRISPTYSIDGQTPESFAVGTSRAQSTATNQTNSKIFETPLLPAGPHTLKVVYEGNSNLNPLTLEFLVVQNGTISSTTTSGSGIPGKSTYGKGSIPVGAIVGGTIGGLALIVFALLGFLFLRQRRKRSVQEWSTNESPTKEWSTQEWSTQAQNSISIPTLLDYTPPHPLHPSNTPSSPQTEQTESVVTHIAKGHVVMLGSETECSTGVSQTAEPLSRSSSGVTACPTNIRSLPRRQPTFTLANPSESPSVPVSPGKTNGEAEASTSRRPRSRGNPSSDPNDTWVPDIVLHADSGVRMPSATVTTSAVDVPPAYTPD